MSTQSTPDEAYFDRDQAALLAAALAWDAGFRVGLRRDPDEPDWPVLVIELPQGQVSWHLPQSEVLWDLPEFPDDWDGHTVADKRARIHAFLETYFTFSSVLPPPTGVEGA